MAKKKVGVVGTAVAMNFVNSGYRNFRIFDNNPDGPSNTPKFNLDGEYYPEDKMSFVNNVAKGEAKNRPDVLVQTANGVACSNGRDKGKQHNWAPDSSWAEDESRNFDGGNMSGF